MSNKLKPHDAQAFQAANKKAGWIPGYMGSLIGNPGLAVAVIHVMHVNEKGEPLYDQAIRAQAGGGVFLPVDENNRLGLQEMYRMQTNDPDQWSKNFKEGKIDWEELGRVSYELCGGFAKAGEKSTDTAKREAQEETGSIVAFTESLGVVVDDKAFSPHVNAVTWGKVDLSRKAADKPDPNEKMLAKIKFFSWAQVCGLIAEGKLYDSFTLSAITMLIAKHPQILSGQILERETLQAANS